jgi:hypothetical protein
LAATAAVGAGTVVGADAGAVDLAAGAAVGGAGADVGTGAAGAQPTTTSSPAAANEANLECGNIAQVLLDPAMRWRLLSAY